jgi:hypothetical protein
MRLTMIYPERRQVSARQVLSWYADRATDEFLRSVFVGPPSPDGDDGFAFWQLANRITPLAVAMEVLQDLGVATFSDAFPRDQELTLELAEALAAMLDTALACDDTAWADAITKAGTCRPCDRAASALGGFNRTTPEQEVLHSQRRRQR